MADTAKSIITVSSAVLTPGLLLILGWFIADAWHDFKDTAKATNSLIVAFTDHAKGDEKNDTARRNEIAGIAERMRAVELEAARRSGITPLSPPYFTLTPRAVEPVSPN